MPKGALHILQIAKDIRMIELEIVQNGDPGTIMDELAALVEESGVILIALDHKRTPRSELRPSGKIVGHATDQPPRVMLARSSKYAASVEVVVLP